MKPIGLLMIEHRLIERMVELLGRALHRMHEDAEADTHLIATGVDFLRIYADRTHHGKEEDILFRELRGKPLSNEHRDIMQQLIQEHTWAREAVGRLSGANEQYRRGQKEMLRPIIHELNKIVEFYPAHIEKEDKHFFIPVMEYFSAAQQQAMLEEFRDFDGQMIHEKYRGIVEGAEKQTGVTNDRSRFHHGTGRGL
jgi:hemerythrin-like domain-containing protein